MSYMSFVAGGELSGGIKYAVGEMPDTRPGSKHLTKLQTNVRLSHEPHSFCTFLLTFPPDYLCITDRNSYI